MGFLERLFAGRTKGNIFVCSYANQRGEAKKFPPRDMVTRRPDQIEKFRAQYDVPGRAVYFACMTVRDRKRAKEEAQELHVLYTDLDFKGIVEDRATIESVLAKLDCQPSEVVFSGHGLHCYWLLTKPLGPEHIERVEGLLKRLAGVLAGDTSAAEIARVLRLPGSHNSKGGDLIEVVEVPSLSSHRQYSIEKLEGWLEGLKPVLTYKSTRKPEAAVARPLNVYQMFYKETRAEIGGFDADELLSAMEYHGVEGNGIDDTHTSIVGAIVAEGGTIDEALQTLLNPTKTVYNRDRAAGDPQWNERLAIKLIKQKFRYFMRRDAKKEQQVSSEDDFEETKEEKVVASSKQMNGHQLNGAKKHDFDFDPGDNDITVSTEALESWGKPNTDLFTTFIVPPMKPEYLPKLIADVAFSNAASMNGDPGALAMSMMTAASAMIATDIKIKVMPQEFSNWTESARVWTVLVGEPGTTKSPLMRAAIEPITSIDFKLGKEFNNADSDYKNLSKDEKAEVDKPVRRTFILNNISIEAGADILFDNPQGVLFFSDEFRALLGTATKYVGKSNSGAEHTSKAFLLSAYNSEYCKVNRIGRGEKFGYPSISMLGSIQPDLLHRMAAAAEDNDGFLQRMTPVFIQTEVLGDISYDNPEHPFAIFHELIDKLYRSPLQFGAAIKFSLKGQLWMNRMLDYCKMQYNIHISSEPALATSYRKMEAMYARWCLIYHMIEHPEAKHAGMISPEIARKVSTLFHEYLEPHITQLHKMSSLNDEHKKLRAIVMYALSHKLKILLMRDLQRGSNQLREIDTKDMRRYMAKLEAMNYGRVMARGKRDRFESPSFNMNPNAAIVMADKVKEENHRLAKARAMFDKLKADMTSTEGLQ